MFVFNLISPSINCFTLVKSYTVEAFYINVLAYKTNNVMIRDVIIDLGAEMRLTLTRAHVHLSKSLINPHVDNLPTRSATGTSSLNCFMEMCDGKYSY